MLWCDCPAACRSMKNWQSHRQEGGRSSELIIAGCFMADLDPLRMAASNSSDDTDTLVFLYGMNKDVSSP